MADSAADIIKSESAFWRFSLRLYTQPDVPALCVALQDDYGFDINLLFYLIFLGSNGRQISVEGVRGINDSIRTWREQVVRPLRAVRRSLKPGIEPVAPDTAEILRNAIKHDELLAERMQQEAMERQFPVASMGQPAPVLSAIQANIAACFEVGAISRTNNPSPNLRQTAIEQFVTALAAAFPEAVKA